MAWTATLIDAQDRDTYWKILVEFTDGTRTAQRAYQFTGATAQDLARFVRAQAQTFEKTDPVDLSPFIGQSIDVTPPDPPPDPTPEELAKRVWFADYNELRSIMRVIEAVPALLTVQVQNRIDALRTSLEAGWINSYLDDA